MAEMFHSGKWKKRAATGLALALSATLSLGVLAACAEEKKEEEKPETPAAKADTQLIKNGNFEFYSEMTTELADKRTFISTPTSWSFTSGSPSSDTKSGLIDVAEYDEIAKAGRELTSVDDAVAHWTDENVTVYDRLKFFNDYKKEIDALESDSEAAKLFADYSYSIDYEDVQFLKEDLGDSVLLHDDNATLPEGEKTMREEGDTGVLMIHNRRTSDGVRGTGQYYTSSTSITLSAGTSAKVSVWAKTSNLYHYGDQDNVEVSQRAGAYIGVTHTVGGTTLDQMQIKNINTKVTNPDGANNGWEQYTVYIRANTYASSTFRIVLGLGKGSTDDRYESVNGYAFFDDLQCEIIPNDDYTEATKEGFGENNSCDLNSKAEDKVFDATENAADRAFSLDLYAPFGTYDVEKSYNFAETAETAKDVEFDLTKEVSGNNTYTSAKIDKSLADNRDDAQAGSVTGVFTKETLSASTNGYLKNIYKNDFENKFPFADESKIVMLLSSNGAAYTAKLPEITLGKNERRMISFFVKTSEIINGRSGATVTLVDGENKTAISAFDSTKIATVDINDDVKDIYEGWVQCFFFVTNTNETPMTFHLELSFGPTTIVGTNKSAYGQGYAAFTNFETCELTKTQASYASTGDRAKNVSLTGTVKDTSVFDTASATTDIEKGLALPSSFTGVKGGSKNVVSGSTVENTVPETVATGLINSQYAKEYRALSEPWVTALNGLAGTPADDSEWWSNIFGSQTSAKVARQPLMIMNTSADATASYGYFAGNATIGASTYQRISMRVKASEGATAYIYLTDTSDVNKGSDTRLSPNLPAVTYWYDDEGNICKSDPAAKEFNKKTDILFYLEDNGLYTKAGANDGVYYANLHNYEKQEGTGHLITKSGTTAFYFHENKYYAYYDEDKDVYSQPVEALPTDNTRYDFREKTLPESVIAVPGTGDWVDVSFYVHTGNEAKTYRLEVWAGERTNAENGLPGNGYVFFDSYSSATVSNYDTLLKDAVDTLKKDTANLTDAEDATSNLVDSLAHYYTFTFYDSTSYLRYDVNEDEEELGNPYGSYKQSEKSEQIVYLRYDDTAGNDTGSAAYSLFLDYSATDVTVEKDDLGGDDEADKPDETTGSGEVNIWLILSSALLGVVLIFAIVAVVVRRVHKKRGKKVKVKRSKKDKRVKPEKQEEEPVEEPEEPKDKDDPYNE